MWCIAHNVPAVYDVLAARIGKRKGINPFLPAFAFAGLPKCGGGFAWEQGRRPTDLAKPESEPPNRRRSVNKPVKRSTALSYLKILLYKYIIAFYDY
jgi:hypothetical protein